MPAHMCRQHTRTFRCASVIDTQAEYVQAGASSFKLQDGRRPLPMKNTVTLFILTSLSYLSFTVNTCSIWNLGVLVLLIGCLLGPFIATTRCHLRTGLVAHRLATTPSIPFKVLSMSVHSLVLKLPSLMAIPVMVSLGSGQPLVYADGRYRVARHMSGLYCQWFPSRPNRNRF